jgi:hypothetical protein
MGLWKAAVISPGRTVDRRLDVSPKKKAARR